MTLFAGALSTKRPASPTMASGQGRHINSVGWTTALPMRSPALSNGSTTGRQASRPIARGRLNSPSRVGRTPFRSDVRTPFLGFPQWGEPDCRPSPRYRLPLRVANYEEESERWGSWTMPRVRRCLPRPLVAIRAVRGAPSPPDHPRRVVTGWLSVLNKGMSHRRALGARRRQILPFANGIPQCGCLRRPTGRQRA